MTDIEWYYNLEISDKRVLFIALIKVDMKRAVRHTVTRAGQGQAPSLTQLVQYHTPLPIQC